MIAPSEDVAGRRFALAILLVSGRYVMQLRDDKPGIAEPGVWALFGGAIEAGESPRDALIREVNEEWGIRLPDCRLLGTYARPSAWGAVPGEYWLYEADITDSWSKHRLMEGQAVKHFSFTELQKLPIPPFIRGLLDHHRSLRAPSATPHVSPPPGKRSRLMLLVR